MSSLKSTLQIRALASSAAPTIHHQGCLSERRLVDIVVYFSCQNSRLRKEVVDGEHPGSRNVGENRFRLAFVRHSFIYILYTQKYF